MSANGTRTIIWSNGEDEFCLAKVGQILALEEKCGGMPSGAIGAVYERLMTGTWGLNDVRETIRLGLIGAGKSPEEAMRIVHLHVDARPLAESRLVAIAIIAAVLVGVPDDPVGKTKAAGAATEAAKDSSIPTAASAAAPSTESAAASDGRHASPTSAPSSSSPPASMDTIAPMATEASQHPSL